MLTVVILMYRYFYIVATIENYGIR
ncbi:MAG: hypothetical protein K0S67_408, partial [Nitrososphaeraceae archaeon]|nr:hypothetical protein [Nitrososphaeraceae archaeon]MDF2768602.1 hypothetical protein [Nitrososphaeraceae archaeon]